MAYFLTLPLNGIHVCKYCSCHKQINAVVSWEPYPGIISELNIVQWNIAATGALFHRWACQVNECVVS